MIQDWVDWLMSGGLLVHSVCRARAVSVRESFAHNWGLPTFWCTNCKADISRFEVPEFVWGSKQPVMLVDEETARLEEMM